MAITYSQYTIFVLAALIMVLIPGPNMLYLITQTLCNGIRSATISLGGIALAFLTYVIIVALGVTSILHLSPMLFRLLKISGAIYLFWIAYTILKKDISIYFQQSNKPTKSSMFNLLSVGFLTNILNPKVAMFYLAFIPQFINVEYNKVVQQILVLGLTQIVVSVSIDYLIILVAHQLKGSMFKFSNAFCVQRWLSFIVLTGLAFKMIFFS